MERESRLSSDLQLAQSQLFPLRKENAKLARENYQLHIDNVKIKDEGVSAVADKVMDNRRLEDSVTELQLLYEHKDRALLDSERTKGKIRDAYETLAGSALKSGPKVRAQMKVSSALDTQHMSAPQPPREMGTSAVREGAIVEAMRGQMDNISATMAKLVEENDSLKASVVARENELTRHARHASADTGGMAEDRIGQLVAADSANQRIIDQLNGQIDFLNEQLALREAQYSETADKARDADRLALEAEHKGELLEVSEGENKNMSAQIRVLEAKVLEFQQALDPENPAGMGYFSDTGSGGLESAAAVAAVAKAEVAGRLMAASPALAGIKTKLERQATPRGAGRQVSPLKENNGRAVAHAVADAVSPGGVGSASFEARLASENSDMRGDVSQLSAQLSVKSGSEAAMRLRLQRGEERLSELKNELVDAVSSADRLARVLDDKERQLSAVSAERDDLLSNLKSELTSSRGKEASEATMSAKITSLVRALDESAREKEHLDALQRELRSELSVTRKDMAETSKRAEDAERRAAKVGGEVEGHGHALTRARQDLMEARTLATKQEMALEEATLRAEATSRRADAVEKALGETQQQLEGGLAAAEAKALAEIRSGSASGAEAALREQLSEVRATLTQWRAKAEGLEEQQAAWVAQKRRMENDMARLGAQASVAAEGQDAAGEEAARAAAQLDSLESELTAANAQIQRSQLALERKESELQGYFVTLNSASADESSAKAASRKQGETITGLESEVRALKNALQDSQGVYSEVRTHGDDTAAALIRKTERLVATERELATAVDKVTVLNDEIAGLEMSLQDAERRAGGVTRRAGEDREDLRRAVAEKENAEARVGELMVLVNSMEAASRSAAEKNSRLTVALQEEGEAQRSLMDNGRKLKAALDEGRVRLLDSRRALDALDKERDELQSLLDERVETLAERERVIAHKALELGEVKGALERSEQRLRAAGSEVAALKSQCSVSNARLASAKQEAAELLRQGTVSRSEVSAAADDLILMTRENQSLTTELSSVSHENGRLRDRLSGLVHNTSSLEQAKRALEIERADLIESYRAVVRDKRKLETDLETLGALKERAGLSSQQLQSQVAELKGHLGAVSGSEARWASERISLGKQVESLNDQLIQSQRRIDSVDADNRRMMQDSHGLRQTNNYLNERVQMIIKRASAATDANKLLSARLGSLERENDAMRAVVSAERQRSTDMETVAATARGQTALRESQMAAAAGEEGASGASGALEERLGLN